MPHLPVSTDPKHQFRLDESFFGKSSRFGYLHSLPDLLVLAALLPLPAVLPLGGALAVSCLMGVVAYRLTFVVHDTSHRTLFARSWENEVMGWIASSVLLVSFPMFRRQHWQHHLHFREAQDPQGSDYNNLVPGRDRVVLHLLKPLLLLNLVEKLKSFVPGLAGGRSAAGTEDAGSDGIKERARPLVAIAGMQALVLLVASHGLQHPFAYLYFLLPLPTIGLFLSRLRGYLEHGNLEPGEAQLKIARTHEASFIERLLLAGIYFHYHNEHHRWPQVPSRQLPRLHAEVTAGRIRACEYSRTYAASLGRLLRACSRRNDASPSSIP